MGLSPIDKPTTRYRFRLWVVTSIESPVRSRQAELRRAAELKRRNGMGSRTLGRSKVTRTKPAADRPFVHLSC
ncbi:hypothetical protein GCM10010987_62980 [Bradyrhizobium guangdongense]|uniref:Uncharacterized protein n=1 Tax=Bradyrhizobium guangdongense TaxID=1325090 RepID=A0AA87W9E6_9BRAD|nr:hypothetical protein GCM10010987_62980 [Bradyrhizobium guangdongense]